MIPVEAMSLLAIVEEKPVPLAEMPWKEAVRGWPFAHAYHWIRSVDEGVSLTERGRQALAGHRRALALFAGR